ncbi:MAG: cytochrome c [Bacteroidia bacterium]
MKTKLALALLSSLLVLTTCTKDSAGPDGCFQEDVLPIFVSNCTMSGCHNSKDKRAGYDLGNYEGIMKGIKAKHPLNSEIYNTIKGNNPSMPQKPYTNLSSKDVNMIKLWINMGARNSSNCKNCDTANFSYSGRIKNIIQVWCVGCHNSGNNGGGFDLSDYNGLVNAIPNNKLLGSIKHLPGFLAMPQTGGRISQCEITAIEKWIGAGHPNN